MWCAAIAISLQDTQCDCLARRSSLGRNLVGLHSVCLKYAKIPSLKSSPSTQGMFVNGWQNGVFLRGVVRWVRLICQSDRGWLVASQSNCFDWLLCWFNVWCLYISFNVWCLYVSRVSCGWFLHSDCELISVPLNCAPEFILHLSFQMPGSVCILVKQCIQEMT